MTYYFYDLETSGVNPRSSRIMQFGGQRTDEELKPIGDPDNILIKLSEDVLPEPDAILVTGITPQKTQAEGMTEAEFVRYFNKNILKPDTIFVGFNNIRFDDEFMRFLFWRNFNEPYEWQWKDGRSRWDILDLSRITRALRPDGISWPFTPEGKPTNSLGFLTAVNKITHADAHDALADVKATIAMAKLIKSKQPKLFDYMLSLRSKKTVNNFISTNTIFVYASGKYSGEFEKTTVVKNLGKNTDNSGVLVYNLRHNPDDYLKMTPNQLAEAWKWKKDSADPRLPVKSLQFNRCPAISPLGVLDEATKKRLKIDLNEIEKNSKKLASSPEFITKLSEAAEILNNQRKKDQSELIKTDIDPDSKLYDGFLSDSDRKLSAKLITAEIDQMDEVAKKLSDSRLVSLYPLYKARNFPKNLDQNQQKIWQNHRNTKLFSGGDKSKLAQYLKRLSVLNSELGSDPNKRFVLEELQLWAESIAPENL